MIAFVIFQCFFYFEDRSLFLSYVSLIMDFHFSLSMNHCLLSLSLFHSIFHSYYSVYFIDHLFSISLSLCLSDRFYHFINQRSLLIFLDLVNLPSCPSSLITLFIYDRSPSFSPSLSLLPSFSLSLFLSVSLCLSLSVSLFFSSSLRQLLLAFPTLIDWRRRLVLAWLKPINK